MVHTSIGGLPLVITAALNLLKTVLHPDAFYGRGVDGSRVFISDDSASERKYLQTAFPQSTLMLCIFHVLQAAWRHIWDSNTGAEKTHKVSLFGCVKDLEYCSSEQLLVEKYEMHVASELVKKHPRFEKYYSDMFERRDVWALCYRVELPMRGHNTNNLDEGSYEDFER